MGLIVDNVNDFIHYFHHVSQTQNITEVFTSGCCYWFAYILCGRFPEAKLMYDLAANHFVAEIGGKLYDITGEVTDQYNVIEWDKYDDSLHKERIIRDCVNFKNTEINDEH